MDTCNWGLKMEQREIVLNKIDTQEREWNLQLEHLKSKVSGFDMEKRSKLEKYVNHLDSKIKSIEKNTRKLKVVNMSVWERHGDSIAICWEELVHNVDYVITNYKNIFNKM